MCGITAYVGENKCRKYVLEGLKRLEYRGYDSAGFVCIDSRHKHLSFSKVKGRLAALQERLDASPHDGFVGMGHTRWATHGVADEINAHPHFDCKKSVAVVHNGIIEHYGELRRKLIEDGHVFYSTTDTETIAHLFESILSKHYDVRHAVKELVSQLKGAYSLVFLMEDHPDQLIVVRHRSPVVIGFNEHEKFVASDPLAFADKTNEVLFLPDDTFAIVKKDSVELRDFENKVVKFKSQQVDIKYTQTGKDGFEHYMLKEIYEQKRAIDKTVRFYRSLEDKIWDQLNITPEQVKNLKTINLVCAGTSWHSARIAQFFFEEICNIQTKVYLASEFRYMKFFPEENNIFVAVSQSGETADTLEALRLVHSYGNIPTIALTNVASSTMVREANGFLLMQAGPEIAVASTKAFSSQLASMYFLACKFAQAKGLINQDKVDVMLEDVFVAAEILESTIEMYKADIIKRIAPAYSCFDRFIFLGRHISYPFALEAALKLKEVSYIFAQCYPSGELKHGPIALVDEKIPIVLFSCLDELIYDKIVSNAQEVKARLGHLVVFAFEGQKELIELADNVFIIPRVNPLLAPLAMTGVMQFFVYQIARELGLPIDKPRNLAKSVTVE